MKTEYDFSKGKRGRIAPPEPEARTKTRITIRIDEDIVEHFLKESDASGGAIGYQTLINKLFAGTSKAKPPNSKKPSAGFSVKRLEHK